MKKIYKTVFRGFLLRENGNASNRDSLGATTYDIKTLKNDRISIKKH